MLSLASPDVAEASQQNAPFTRGSLTKAVHEILTELGYENVSIHTSLSPDSNAEIVQMRLDMIELLSGLEKRFFYWDALSFLDEELTERAENFTVAALIELLWNRLQNIPAKKVAPPAVSIVSTAPRPLTPSAEARKRKREMAEAQLAQLPQALVRKAVQSLSAIVLYAARESLTAQWAPEKTSVRTNTFLSGKRAEKKDLPPANMSTLEQAIAAAVQKKTGQALPKMTDVLQKKGVIMVKDVVDAIVNACRKNGFIVSLTKN